MPYQIENSGIDLPTLRETKVLVRNSLHYQSEYEQKKLSEKQKRERERKQNASRTEVFGKRGRQRTQRIKPYVGCLRAVEIVLATSALS